MLSVVMLNVVAPLKQLQWIILLDGLTKAPILGTYYKHFYGRY
jgi:hypothetical protein